MQEILRTLEEIAGQEFVRESLDVGVIYRCRAFDIEFSLLDQHDLEDDCGIEFSAFKFQLDLTAFRIGFSAPGFETMYQSMAVWLLSYPLPTRISTDSSRFVHGPDL